MVVPAFKEYSRGFKLELVMIEPDLGAKINHMIYVLIAARTLDHDTSHFHIRPLAKIDLDLG